MEEIRERQELLKSMLDKKELVNGWILTEDGGEFNVHLEVLAGWSPYIYRIIKAAKRRAWNKILIPGLSKVVTANIINFVYTGELQLSFENISDLAKAGEILEIPDIINLCVTYLEDHMNDENCMKIYNFAKQSQYHDLEQKAVSYILVNFQKIFPVSNEFLNFDASELMTLLSSDDLIVSGEEYVFWALMRWVEKDAASRMNALPQLLLCVRFGLCNPQYYERNILTHPFVSINHECQAILLQVSALFTDITGKELSNNMLDPRHPFLRPRVPDEIIFVMGGWSHGEAATITETFDVKSNRWFLPLTEDAVPTAYHGMLWHKRFIYVIGGFDGLTYFNIVRRFDPESKIWEEKGPMHVQRCYVSVAAINDYIYAMGGNDGHNRHNSCERFDAESNQWMMVASMNHVRSDADADTLNGKIYIAGGFNGHNMISAAEVYDPETDHWTPISRMISPRSGLKVAAYNNFLYAIGGFDGSLRLQSVEKYDSCRRVWTEVPNMNGKRSNFAVSVLYDCLYVIGGFNGFGTVPFVEFYDHQTNVWTEATELNYNRSALAACTVKGISTARDFTYLGNV